MVDPARLDEVLKRRPREKDRVEAFRAVDARRKELQGKLDALRSQRNQANDQMAKAAKADPKSPEFAKLRDDMRAVSQQVKDGEGELARLEDEARTALLY